MLMELSTMSVVCGVAVTTEASLDADVVGHDVSGVAVTTEASLDADGVGHDVSSVAVKASRR